MAPTTLTTHHPSPTTTAYTVSNAPLHPSPLTHLATWTAYTLRLTLGLLALAALALQGAAAAEAEYLSKQYQALLATSACSPLVTNLLVAAISMGLLYMCTRRRYTTESLLAIRGLGVQISTSGASYLSSPTTRFIPTAQIQDIYIYEAFRGFEVRFYLAIVVEGEDEVVVVFPKLLPRRAVLESVWRGARGVLWGFGEK